ncbi:MAG: hypothetical protein ACPG5B_00065 [Chitinophagales bacterium]
MLKSMLTAKNFNYILLLFTLFLIQNKAFCQGQTYYIGSSQFFDISGEWINESEGEKRISRLNITKTIVNTYRMKPYFSLGKKELPSAIVPLEISEAEMAYIARVAEAKCMVLPMETDGKQKLKVYSIIITPDGIWTGLAIDELVRKTANPPKNNAKFNAATEMGDYWLNEWKDGQVITRFRLFAQNNRLTKAKIYRREDDRERLVGEFPVKRTTDDHTQIVEVLEGDVLSTFYFRPIRLNYQTQGIDLVVEEMYTDNAPKNIYRQFYKRDRHAARKEAAEEMIKKIGGEWVNVIPSSPTSRIVIYDGEAEFWVNCDNNEMGECRLGKKEIKAMGNDMVGVVLPSMASIRTVEIDVNLQVNDYFKGQDPNVMAITTNIEDIEGIKMPIVRTEIFKRKDVVVPPKAFDFKVTKNKD